MPLSALICVPLSALVCAAVCLGVCAAVCLSVCAAVCFSVCVCAAVCLGVCVAVCLNLMCALLFLIPFQSEPTVIHLASETTQSCASVRPQGLLQLQGVLTIYEATTWTREKGKEEKAFH